LNNSARRRYFDAQRLPFTLPALSQPCSQALRKAFGGNSKARFYNPIGQWQRIVKLHRIREVPHAKLIQPLQWTQAPLPPYHDFNPEFLRVHFAIIPSRLRPPFVAGLQKLDELTVTRIYSGDTHSPALA